MRSSRDHETLESLIALAEEVDSVLVPVEPGQEFRTGLRDRLLGIVRQRPAGEVIQPSEKRRWALIIGATLGSLLPVLGVVAYLLRSRLTGKPQHAPSH